MTTASTTSDTEPRGGAAALAAHVGPAAHVAPTLAALALLAALFAPGPLLEAAPPPRASASDLRDLLEKGEKSLRKAGSAVSGHDPGRVSALLRSADEHLARFEEASRIDELIGAFESGRSQGRAGEMGVAADAVRRARTILTTLADYALTREAELAGRAALAAAEAGDGPGYLEALARLETAILAPHLRARIQEARAAIARGRAAMVRRDMAAGKTEVAAALRALGGLRYAGALSRAIFGLRVAADLIEQGATLAARDQVRRALLDLTLAREQAPEPERASLDEAHARAYAIWQRLGRRQEGDAASLGEIAGTVADVRARQR